jgi:alcohol dehydrogenase class IV
MTFDFCIPTRVLFGPGVSSEIEGVMQSFGIVPFLVTGTNFARHERVLGGLARKGSRGMVCGEPDFESVRELVLVARRAGCDSVLALGGGSVIDTGKAVAMLLANGGDPLDYAEVIGSARPVDKPSVPCLAVPTTAGAGSEVTRNAVLRSREHGVKVSLRSPRMIPTMALVDPELTLDLPPEVTAATGLDALSQVLEPFVSSRANAFTDNLCRDGLMRISRSLRVAYENGRDLCARTDMALGALYGGMALANAGLGAVHGFAAALGGLFHAPHGALCAALLAPVMEANLRLGDASVVARYTEAAQILCGNPRALAQEGVQWVRDCTRALRIPGLSVYGVGPRHVPDLCERAKVASSMKGNPVALDRDALHGIISAALH